MDNLIIRNTEILEVDLLLFKVTRQLNRTRRYVLNKFDLTSLQFEILTAIYLNTAKMEVVIQIDLAKKILADPMTTSNVLRILQKKGLVERKQGLVNTKTKEISLTKRGQDLCEKARFDIDEMRKSIYMQIEVKLLMGQLKRLSSQLTKLHGKYIDQVEDSPLDCSTNDVLIV